MDNTHRRADPASHGPVPPPRPSNRHVRRRRRPHRDAARLVRRGDRVGSRSRLPVRPGGVPHLRGDGRRGAGRGRRLPGDRRALLDREELQGPRPVGGEGLGQRRDRRARAGGDARRPPPRRRAHEPRDDAVDPALADRGLRLVDADHEHRRQPRDLDRLRDEPGRGDVRHQGRQLPLLAQEPPADEWLDCDRDRPQPELRLPLGLLRRGQLVAEQLALPRQEPRSPRPRREPSATSSGAASSTAASRSARR